MKKLDCLVENKDDFAVTKTNLAVSSIEFCQCKYCESNIGLGLSSGGGHRAMIPLMFYLQAHSTIFVTAHPLMKSSNLTRQLTDCLIKSYQDPSSIEDL